MADAPQAKFQPFRVNAPGFGPKLIRIIGTLDLTAQICIFAGAGAPAAGTLLAGNGQYILKDLYLDTTANALYLCTAAGTNATATWTKISGGGSSANWNYRGLYTPQPSTPYMTFDLVLLQSGTSAGTYLSMVDNNNTAPDIGPGWLQISTLYGQWQ